MFSTACGTTSSSKGARICWISRSLPALLLAMTILFTRSGSQSQGRLLQRDQLPYALLGQVEHAVHFAPMERRALGSALHFHVAAAAGHDHVHVGIAGGVFQI